MAGADLGPRRARRPTAAWPRSAPRSRRSPEASARRAAARSSASSSRPIRVPRPRELATLSSRASLAVTEPATADHAAGTIVGQRLAALIERDEPAYLLAGAGPEGRDSPGVVSALTGWGVLVNAIGRDLGRRAGRRDERLRRAS